MKSVYNIKYQFPKKELLEYFYQRYPLMKEWETPSYFKDQWLTNSPDSFIKGFKVDEALHEDPFLRKIANEFCNYYLLDDKFITQFLSIEPNKTLPWHEDGVPASCCINCLLSDDNVPVEFEEDIYYYNVGLLNIRKKHRVSNGNSLRIMFRIVFYDEDTTFEKIKNILYAKDLS